MLARAAKPVLKAAAAVVAPRAGASVAPDGAVRRDRRVRRRRERLRGADDSSAKTAQRLGLIAAGSAAGISAGFGAPIAGVVLRV